MNELYLGAGEPSQGVVKLTRLLVSNAGVSLEATTPYCWRCEEVNPANSVEVIEGSVFVGRSPGLRDCATNAAVRKTFKAMPRGDANRVAGGRSSGGGSSRSEASPGTSAGSWRNTKPLRRTNCLPVLMPANCVDARFASAVILSSLVWRAWNRLSSLADNGNRSKKLTTEFGPSVLNLLIRL